MNTVVKNNYRRFREAGIGGVVGQDASNCLDAARVLAQFDDLEFDGLVRLRTEHEQESYWSVYGKPESAAEKVRIESSIDLYGCVCVIAEYRDAEGEWQHADSIGMCIYNRPECPFQNCYVVGLMQAAVNAAMSSAVVI